MIGSGGSRFFGYAIGSSFPVSMAADWLVSAWDQNVPYYVSSPSMAIVEETAAEWVLELLGLSKHAGLGFTSGAQEAIYTALITARNTLLQRAGWDVVKQGLYGAPRIQVVVSDQIHSTIKRALSMIGIGSKISILFRPTVTYGSLPIISLRYCRVVTVQHLFARKLAVLIPAPLIRSMHWLMQLRTIQMLGCTWMGRLGFGRQPVTSKSIWLRELNGQTPLIPMATNGLTCHMTAA